jgi:hypothetical protein
VKVTDLCGAHLCMENAVCSYILRGVRVHLCADHLRELRKKTSLSFQEIATKLPGFMWVGSPVAEESA